MALFGKTSKKPPKPSPRPARTAGSRGGKERVVTATSPEESRRIALLIAEAGLDKKALAIDILDVRGKVDYADFLVLMTGQTDRHVAAVARGVDEHLSKNGIRSVAIEGLPAGQWVLIDFVDVVVHVFLEETRSLYDLDGLWLDARRIPVPETTPVDSSTP